MKNSLIVKDNALINASYNLELTEQRLIMLAIINARESGHGITADSKLEIHASDYAKLFNVSADASYKALREAVNNLFNRQFSYSAEYKRTGKVGIVRSRWVSRIFYVDDLALLEITFAPDVVPLITRLEEHFTKYEAKRDPNTPDFFIKMTDAQRHLFANKMSEMPEMGIYSQGTESYQQFAIRIADMLLEPEKFRVLYPILEKAGFQP